MLPRVLVLAAALAPVIVAAPAAVGAQEPECWLARGTPAEAAERASPLGETLIVLGTVTGKACYGRPSARGRPVAGNLIPFGQPWRMGANEATVLHLPFPAVVGDLELEPGSYSLYTVAGEEEWNIVANGTAERWGIPINDDVVAADLGTVTVPSAMTEDMVEQLTFTWEAEGDDRGVLVVEWEHTRVEIPIRKRGT